MNVSPTGVALQYAVTPHHSPTAPTINQSITQPKKVYPTRENQAKELFFFVIEGNGKKEAFLLHIAKWPFPEVGVLICWAGYTW
jgi:hypothetical protein